MNCGMKRVLILTMLVALIMSLCPAAMAADEGDLAVKGFNQSTVEPIFNNYKNRFEYPITDPGEYSVTNAPGIQMAKSAVVIKTTGASIILNGVNIDTEQDPSIYSQTDGPDEYNLNLSLEPGSSNAVSWVEGFNVELKGPEANAKLIVHERIKAYQTLKVIKSIAKVKFIESTSVEFDSSKIIIEEMFSEETFIKSGTVKIDKLDTYHLYINGGSVDCGRTEAQRVDENYNETPVYLVKIKLQDAGEGTVVTNVDSTDTSNYVFNGSETDENGLLCYFLEKGVAINSITAGGKTYTSEVPVVVGDSDEPAVFIAPVDPGTPGGESLPYDVTRTSATGDYVNDAKGLVIERAGEFIVKSNHNPATVPITIAATIGKVKLTLNGVNTEIPTTTESPALWITKDCGADVTLVLNDGTENTLSGGNKNAGLQKDNGDAAWLIIDGPGALNANGGVNGAGIGGGDESSASKIRFVGGNIISTSGLQAAGIGGGAHGSASNIEVVGGTIQSVHNGQGSDIGGGDNGSASNIVITGGSVNADIPAGIDRIPVVIDMQGAGNKTAISQVDFGDLEYGLEDVRTMNSKLYFWLPKDTVITSVTTAGETPEEDKEYTAAEDIEITESTSVKLYPPQFIGVDETGAIIPNTYRYGAQVSRGIRLTLSEGVEEAKALISILPSSGEVTEVTLDGVIVDTSGREDSSNIVFSDGPVSNVVLRFLNQNHFSSFVLNNSDQYSVELVVTGDDSVDIRNFIISKPVNMSAASKALVSLTDYLVDLPGVSLKNGSGNGEGSLTIVKRGTGNVSMALKNVDMSLSGFMPAEFKMTIDENSTLTLEKDAILVLLDGTTITGAGQIQVDGRLVGDVGVDVLYAINTSAMGDWPLTLSGVTDGYAKAGDSVTIGITQEEGFVCWDLKPAIEGLDLSQNTLSFIADKAYDVEAIYEVKPKSVEFDKAKYEVETGDTQQLKWSFKPKKVTNTSVTFTSSNPEIVEVDEEGLVYGVSSGDAVITITTIDGGFTATCSVTVVDPPVKPLDVPVAAIKLNGSMKLKAPTGYVGTWSTGDEKIASIINNKKLKGVALGGTTLTFTVTEVVSKRPSLVNGKVLTVGESASVPLNVRKKKELVSSIGMGAKTIYLAPGEELTLSPTLKPKTALDRAVVYRTGNTRIVRVEGGTLIAMSEGKTNLIATASSFKTKKVSLVVTTKLQKLIPQTKKAKIKVGDYVRFTALTQPRGLEDVPITWSSKKPGVATVDEFGLVKGIKNGKATIVAKSGKKKATFVVTVK